MNKLLLLCCATYILLSAVNLYAQEIQVPMDVNGKVNVVDSAMNQKYGIFVNYEGFFEARLFKISDSSFSMEVYYKVDDKLNRHKTNMSFEEVKNFRTSVSEKLHSGEVTTIDQSGRTELLWGLTLAGLTTYGPASIYLSDADGSVAVGLYMLTSAASFLVPYFLTDNIPVSNGAARLSLWGAFSGAGHGMLLYQMMELDRKVIYDDTYSYTEINDQALWGLVALTSMVEAYAGYRIAQSYGFSAGKSDLMVNTSVAGTGALPGLMYLFGVENEKTLYGSAILGTFGGYVLGNYISNTQNYSRGDAICFANTWSLSAALPVSLLIAAKSDEPKLYVGTAIVGAGLGMWLGNELVKAKDFSTSQGVYMSLGSFGGAFVTGGLSFLLIGDDEDNWKIIPPIMALGAIGGFAITYLVFADEPKSQEKSLSSGFKLDFNPLAISTAFSNVNESNFMQYRNNPVLSLTYKF